MFCHWPLDSQTNETHLICLSRRINRAPSATAALVRMHEAFVNKTDCFSRAMDKWI